MAMLKEASFCVLVLLSSLDIAFGQSDADTQCSALDHSVIPKTCCVRPSAQLFPIAKLAATTKRCKASSRLMAWLNQYKINALQLKNIGNLVDHTDPATKNTLCTFGSFMECVFRENLWLDDTGNIDVYSIMLYLKNVTANDVYWQRIYLEMLYPVSSPVYPTSYLFNDMVIDHFESIRCGATTVNLKPLMIAQMIQSELIWMCPEQSEYTAANGCTQKMNNYQYCDGKIYSLAGNGVFFFTTV